MPKGLFNRIDAAGKKASRLVRRQLQMRRLRAAIEAALEELVEAKKRVALAEADHKQLACRCQREAEEVAVWRRRIEGAQAANDLAIIADAREQLRQHEASLE